MNLQLETDEALLRRVALAQDQHAFRAIVERHKDFGTTLAVRILKDTRIAEEALQDAFLRVWRSAPSFGFKSRFKTWFYRILYNVCLSKLAKEQTNLETEELEDVEHASSLDDGSKETLEIFESSLMRLPEKCRTVMTLFYLQELSYEEIVEITEMPIGTVKTLLFRGRERLKKDVLLREHLLN